MPEGSRATSTAIRSERNGPALATIERQFRSIIQRWCSTYSDAPLEALLSIFQAARARAWS